MSLDFLGSEQKVVGDMVQQIRQVGLASIPADFLFVVDVDEDGLILAYSLNGTPLTDLKKEARHFSPTAFRIVH